MRGAVRIIAALTTACALALPSVSSSAHPAYEWFPAKWDQIT